MDFNRPFKTWPYVSLKDVYSRHVILDNLAID